MRNNETGEFELVIGNKQIFSGFFIVVALFAVGVAMGYILGQNSPRSSKLPADTSGTPSATDARPQPASPAAPATPPAGQGKPGDSAAQQQPPADGAPQPTTQPVRDDQATAASKPAPPAAEPAPPAAAPAEAAAGTYWQVMALARADADAVVRTLKNAGFPATTSPGTKGLTRVLAGPYNDRAALGRAKTDLEAHGFVNIYRVEIDPDAAGRK
jgi:cell division septation protein DedD